jgi:hypothetical protein
MEQLDRPKNAYLLRRAAKKRQTKVAILEEEVTAARMQMLCLSQQQAIAVEIRHRAVNLF